jgi:hypothetical protein
MVLAFVARRFCLHLAASLGARRRKAIKLGAVWAYGAAAVGGLGAGRCRMVPGAVDGDHLRDNEFFTLAPCCDARGIFHGASKPVALGFSQAPEKRISKFRFTIASPSLFAVSIDSRRVTSRVVVANMGPVSKKSACSALDVAAGALCLHGAEWF